MRRFTGHAPCALQETSGIGGEGMAEMEVMVEVEMAEMEVMVEVEDTTY